MHFFSHTLSLIQGINHYCYYYHNHHFSSYPKYINNLMIVTILISLSSSLNYHFHNYFLCHPCGDYHHPNNQYQKQFKSSPSSKFPKLFLFPLWIRFKSLMNWNDPRVELISGSSFCNVIEGNYSFWILF